MYIVSLMKCLPVIKEDIIGGHGKMITETVKAIDGTGVIEGRKVMGMILRLGLEEWGG